jgi:hypothetical protein
MFMLHVKDFKLSYSQFNQITQPYLAEDPDSIVFVNLYLMPRVQFQHLVSTYTRVT